jgi:hypothetical protein
VHLGGSFEGTDIVSVDVSDQLDELMKNASCERLLPSRSPIRSP